MFGSAGVNSGCNSVKISPRKFFGFLGKSNLIIGISAMPCSKPKMQHLHYRCLVFFFEKPPPIIRKLANVKSKCFRVMVMRHWKLLREKMKLA